MQKSKKLLIKKETIINTTFGTKFTKAFLLSFANIKFLMQIVLYKIYQ